MTNNLKRWEFLYLFINSSFTAILWAIPIVLSIIATSAYFVYRFTDLFFLILTIIFMFIVVGLFQLCISKKIESLKISINETIETLKENRNSKVDEVSNRSGRIYPDGGKVGLSEYNKLIQSIHRYGYYEFKCQPLNATDYKPKGALFIFKDYPGMSKILLVGAQQTTSGFKEILRIYSPNDIDARDFAITWFDNIFRILGNVCPGISELQDGASFPNGELTGDYYLVTKYKFFRRHKESVLRIYID